MTAPCSARAAERSPWHRIIFRLLGSVLASAFVACSERQPPASAGSQTARASATAPATAAPATAAQRSDAHLRSVLDTAGRALALPARVTRVVSLAPSVTEILYAVGAGPLVVGTDQFSDFPAAARALPKVGSVLEPSLERILALRPDLVCTATTANSEETTRTLERLGLPVYVSSDSALVDIERDLERLGEAVGHGDEGRRARQQFHDALEALRRPPASPPVRLLVVVWPDPLVAAGAASPVGELLALLGATNAADEAAAARTPYPTIDLERLLVRPPSLIVLGTHGREAPPLGSLERMLGPRRRIERLDGDLLFRPGPRLIEGARALAALLPTAGTSLPPKGTP